MYQTYRTEFLSELTARIGYYLESWIKAERLTNGKKTAKQRQKDGKCMTIGRGKDEPSTGAFTPQIPI